MDTPSMIGLGIGLAVVGAIFGLLSIFKPDAALFKKYTQEQFCRVQGMMLIDVVLGALLILDGVMQLLGVLKDMNPPAAMLGSGVGLALVGGIFAMLSFRKPDVAVFRNAKGKKLYQTQGALMMVCAYGVLFIILGLMGKPWAV